MDINEMILREAEKQTDEFINIVWRKDNNGEYSLCAVAFLDGAGRPVDYLSGFGTPDEVLNTLRERNEDRDGAERMFTGIQEETKFVTSNID